MTEHTAARTPAALAEHLGLTVPQLAQRLALLTQTEGLTGRGLTLDAEHLTAAEVLGVLAACPAAAHTEPVPALDVTHPFFNRASELCWAVEHYLAGEGSRAELGAAAARLMPLLGFAPERAQAVRAAAQQNTPPQRCPRCEGRGVLDVYTPDGPPVCPVCEGSGTPEPDALGVYLAAQAERAASSTPLTPSTPAAEVEP